MVVDFTPLFFVTGAAIFVYDISLYLVDISLLVFLFFINNSFLLVCNLTCQPIRHILKLLQKLIGNLGLFALDE